MIIEELNLISFGKFKNKKIELSEGINIIYGNNESGKTTIHSFIEAMFYGFFNPNTKTKRYTQKYDSYLPWNYSDYRGILKYKVNNQTYRIERNFLKGNDDVKIFDEDLGEDISSQFNYNKVIRLYEPFSLHLDINNTIYKNTISINQSQSRITNDFAKHVKDNLVNIGQSLDEDISVNRVLQKLDDGIKEIGTKGRVKSPYGSLVLEIEDLKAEENLAEEREEAIRDYEKQLLALGDEIKLTENKRDEIINILELLKDSEITRQYLEAKTLIESIDDLEKSIKKLNKYEDISLEDRDLLIRFEDNVKYIKESIEVSKNKYDETKNKLKEVSFDINKVLNDNQSSDNFNEEGFTSVLVSKNKKLKVLKLFRWVAILITLGSIYLGYFEDVKYSIGAILSFIVILIISFYSTKLNKDIQHLSNKYGKNNSKNSESTVNKQITNILQEKINQEYEDISILKNRLSKEYKNIEFVLNRNKTDSIEGYHKAVELKNKLLKQKEEATNKKILLKQLLGNKTIQDLKQKMEAVGDIDLYQIKNYNKEELESNLKEKDEYINKLKNKQLIYQEKIKDIRLTKRLLVDVHEDIIGKKKKLHELSNKLNSLKLAKNTIEEISKDIHKDFAPKLNKMVNEITSSITNDKYNEVKMSENMDVRVVDPSSSRLVSIEDLSGGTIDQFYFAVRLGIIDLLSENKNIPLLLDDTFIQYDNIRLHNILKVINNISNTKQILLFTCHYREKEYFDKLGLKYNYINV